MILTDDLSWNLVQYMPQVQRMQNNGLTFTNYFVTDSFCCPSRSSIFTGKFPHDTQVFTNTPPYGGYNKFESAGNASETFATALSAAGYATAMMGKYLNGYTPEKNQADPGWSDWDVAGDGYPEFNYDLNQNGTIVVYGNDPNDYLVDVLSGLGQQFITASADKPFMLEVATFAPHAPYTPAPRYVNAFNVQAPRTASFNAPGTNMPEWLSRHQPLDANEIAVIDKQFNLRVEAVQAVDDLIAGVFATLQATGHDKDTYVFFTSDNGYHMGEHMLEPGKQTAFDTDINVPLIVVGPGVRPGTVVGNIAENIDLCPTFAQLGNTQAPPTVDGASLVPFLQGQTVTDWRDAALVEHVGPPLDPNDPDNEPGSGPMPNSYEAIRMASSLYVEYQDGGKEYYDLASDPDELSNTAAQLTPAQAQTYHDTLAAIQHCHNAVECWAAQKMQP